MTNLGINYGAFDSNLDTNTGIRYGVINQGAVGDAWYSDSEPFYGDPHCPYCGDELPNLDTWEDEAITCQSCSEDINMDESSGDPISWFFEDSEYSAEASNDSGDIFITKSPYFTYAQFCSPCAPGAVHLENPLELTTGDFEPIIEYQNNKGYCFGHDWFENEVAPYDVFSVETGKIVMPEKSILNLNR